MRRSREEVAKTCGDILQVAENLFLEKGYENVTLEDVAVELGLSRGAVQWHYKNKEGLLFALCERAQEPFRALARDFAEQTGAASVGKLADVVSSLFDELENDPRQQNLVRVMVLLESVYAERGDRGTPSVGVSLYDNLLPIFAAIDRDSGLPPPWVPQTAASMLCATISGLVKEWGYGGGALRLSPDGQAFIEMILASWKR